MANDFRARFQVLRLGGSKLKVACLFTAVLATACGGGGGDKGNRILADQVGCDGTVRFAEATGTFPNGTPWAMRAPAGWNGVLINDLDYVDKRANVQSCLLMQRGYALSGTNRNPQRNFMYDPERETNELIAVMDMFTERYDKPTRVIQHGTSGGGFVALNFAERYPSRVDGVVAACAHEPVPLMNMMHDGWFVLKTLLAPELQIVGFNDLATVTDQATKWRAALTAAQQTASGRARIALAVAIGQWPAWSTGSQPVTTDVASVQKAMFDTVMLNAGQPGGQSRFMFEHVGPSADPRSLSWNTDVDYSQLLSRAEPLAANAVQALYADAGLNVQSDLSELRNATRLQADPAAITFWNAGGRTVKGVPKVPVLRTHTTGDNAVPPIIVDSYAQKMQANTGDKALYRTSFVDRAGHCTFDPSEAVAAIETVLARVQTGTWPDTGPQAMNARARALVPTATPQFVNYTPVTANRPQHDPTGRLN